MVERRLGGSSIPNQFGNKNVLDKKVPRNKKYDGVKSTLNTGKTMKDVELVSDQLVAKRKSERFKRIKCSTLAKLISEGNYEESIYRLHEGEGEEGRMQAPSEHLSDLIGGGRREADTESVYSAQTGITQASAVTYATDMLGITSDTSFLLLDLRDPEDYLLYRIKESVNFPKPNIARDKLIPEIFRFKNKPDKLIIIYMQDERNGTSAAQMFFEKGFENIFLLSGGIEQFLEEFNHLCEGRAVPVPRKLYQIEEEKKKEVKMEQRKKKHAHCMDEHHHQHRY